MRALTILLLTSIALSSCVLDKGKVDVNIKRNSTSAVASSTVTLSNVQIVNNQLIITGSGLTNVTDVKVNGNSLNQNFTIETQSATKIIANAVSAFSFDVSKVFNLILSDANASATFPIDFSLCNSTLNGRSFDCSITANDKDVLSYDGLDHKWKPRQVNGLTYQGAWDATKPDPVTASPGDYFIVSVANAPFAVGDWIVWNGASYDQISNSTAITSVFGRSGNVVATKGDYNLNKLLDVDLTIAPVAGKVLKYDGAKWIAGDDSGGSVNSVVTTSITNGAVTDAKIDTISASKITGTITSAQILDGTIVSADISATAAIPYSKLNIADGDIPAAKISGLTGGAALATTIVNGDSTHAPDGNAVFNALALKLNLSGGALSIGGTITGLPALPLAGSEATSKDYVDSRTASSWTTSGSNIFYNTGNIGVGTTTPSTLIEAKGPLATITVTGTGASNYIGGALLLQSAPGIGSGRANGVFMYSADRQDEWYAGTPYTGGGSQYVLGYKSAMASHGNQVSDSGAGGANNALFVINSNGKVGIGTTSPAQMLSVAGTVQSTSGGFMFPDGTTQTTSATGGGGSSQWTTSGSNIYYNTAGGVGIGTTTAPSGMLMVNGRSDLGSGFLIANGSGAGGTTNATNIWSPTIVTAASYAPETALRIDRSSDHSSRFSNTFDVQIGSYAGSYEASTQVNFVLANGTTYTPDVNVMSLLANGKVGIGTDTPGQKLSVAGTVESTSGGFKFPDGTTQTTASGSGSFLPLTGGSITGNLNVSGNLGFGTTNPQSPFVIANGTNKQGLEIQQGTTYTRIFSYDRNASSYLPIVFDGSSKVGIGTTSPGYMLDVQGGDINASGSVRAATVALTSDRRWKRDIRPLENSIEKLKKITGVSYVWARDEYPEKHFNSEKQIGVIAQDVQKVFPELVLKDKDGFLSVNYPALIAPLIEAFKDQQTQIADLKTKNLALEQYLCKKDPSAPFCH